MDDFDIDESIDIDSSDSFETTSLDSTVDVMDSVDVPEESFDAVELDDTSLDDYSEINEDSYNSEIDDIMNDAEIDNLEFDSDIEEIPEDSLDVMDDVSVEELDFDDTNSIEDSDIVQEELDQPMDDQFEEVSEEVEQPTEEIDISAEENVLEDVEQSSDDQFVEMSEEVEQPTEEIDISAEENVLEDVEQSSDDQFVEMSEEVEQPTEEIDISAEENVLEDVEQSSDDQFVEMSEEVEQPTEEIDISAEENVLEDVEQSSDDQFVEMSEEIEQPTEEIDVSAEENVPEDVAEISDVEEALDPHEALSNMSEYMNEHNYGLDDYETYSQDPEWQALNRDLQAANGIEPTEYEEDVAEISDVEEALDPHEALSNMSEYMNEHNYGLDDYETYSQDPEWQALNRDLQAANGIEPTEYEEDVAEISDVEEALDPHEALSNMSEYMNEHNYGLDDYETYSQDPEWQALNRDLQVANGIEPTEYAEDVAEIAEENENEIVNNIENLDREYDDFERSVIDTNPDFYETGSFYQQGINEFGYQGTCGPTSQANAINELLGTNELTENKVLSVAIDNNLCQTHGDMDSCGGTSTEQFMDLYDKMNEQLGDKFDTELFEYGDVLDADQVADRLDNGDVVNVAVDACALWDMPRDYVNDLGVRQDDFYSDHWITVTGVQRLDDGTIKGFDIIDSGGGENYVSLDKYNDMCFGTEEHRVIDPTCIVLSKKDVGLANGPIDRKIITDTTIENDNSTTKKPGLFD